jgi:hypothetical protein
VLIRLALTVAAIYVLIVVAVFLLQNRMLYFPAADHAATPTQLGMPMEDVQLTTQDGVRLHGWWIPREESRGAVLFLHGNGGNISYCLLQAAALWEMGLDVFLLDYRGYGNSEGTPSETGTYLDAEAAYDYLAKERNVPAERLLLFGQSLGGAVAVELAGRRPAAGLITEATFSSLADIAAPIYWWLPVRLLLRSRYESKAKIGKLQLPILLLHSKSDELVSYDHAQRLLKAAGEGARHVPTAGGHNDGGFMTVPKGLEEVRAFVTECLGE